MMPMMRRMALALSLASACLAQNAAPNQRDVVKRGEQVFAASCATAYCHGAKGGPGGAPRLAGRGFDHARTL